MVLVLFAKKGCDDSDWHCIRTDEDILHKRIEYSSSTQSDLIERVISISSQT